MAKMTRVGQALKAAKEEALANEKRSRELRASFSAAATKLRGGARGRESDPGKVDQDSLGSQTKHENPFPGLFKATLKGYRFPKVRPHVHKKPAPLRPAPATDDPPSFPVCFFPANDGSVLPGPLNQYDAGNAALKLYLHSSGVQGPGGISFGPVTPGSTRGFLQYGFVPPIDGTLTVIAAVLVTGTMGVWGSFPLFSVWADARLELRLTIWQQGVMRGSDMETAAHLHCSGNSDDSRVFFDENFSKICDGYVVNGEPVVVQLEATLVAQGNSDFAHAELNFTQSGRPNNTKGAGIRVPELCMALQPAVPVVVN